MRSFYERQRPAFFSAMVLLDVASMVVTFADGNNLEGFKPGDWIIAELFVAPICWWQRWLHNETAYQVERRLQWKGLPMTVSPLRVRERPARAAATVRAAA